MVTYTKLIIKDKNRKKTIFLKNSKTVFLPFSQAPFTVGYEVKSNGDSPFKKGDRIRLIDNKCIVKRIPMVMNNFYCELEEA